MTRGEAVTFLWRLQGEPESTREFPFRDVPDEAFYREAVAWAYENGITTGLSPTQYGGGFWIDRAQALTLMYRYHLRFGPPAEIPA